MPKIDDIITNASRFGISRTNQFQIEIPISTLLPKSGSSSVQQSLFNKVRSSIDFDTTSRLNLMCENTHLPGKTTLATEVKTYGNYVKNPYLLSFTELPAVFRVGADMFEKYFFDYWSSLVVDQSNMRVGYKKDYSVDIIVSQIDKDGNKIASVNFFEAFPSVIGDMNVNQDELNNYHRLPVSFSFNKWQYIL